MDKTALVTVFVTDVETAALELRQIGIAGDFTVSAETGEVGFDIILFVTRCAEVADADIDDMIGQSESLKQSFFIFQTEFVIFGGFFRFAENDLFDFVELMHPEDAFGSSAVTSSFSTEAGGVSRIAEGQFRTVENIVGMITDQSLLTGTDQSKIFAIDEKKFKVGYEIPFTRYFYKYEAPRPSSEIMKEIMELEKELDGALAEVFE